MQGMVKHYRYMDSLDKCSNMYKHVVTMAAAAMVTCMWHVGSKKVIQQFLLAACHYCYMESHKKVTVEVETVLVTLLATILISAKPGVLAKTTLPSAGLLICKVLFGSLTPVRMIGRERSGGDMSSVLSVITIHGGSPSPVYPSTAALLTCM